MAISPEKEKRRRRHLRVRSKISGTTDIPRLCVFKSNKYIYCQLIDDERSQTLLSANDLEIKKTTKKKTSKTSSISTKELKDRKTKGEKKPFVAKTAIAYEVGKLIAEKALKKKIKKVVFDRGGFSYHGRVKALAEGAREGGLNF